MSSATERYYERYWSGLNTFMEERRIPLQLYSPSKEAWQIIGDTWSNRSIRIAAKIHRKENAMHVDVTLDGPFAKQRFNLEKQKTAIQNAIGARNGKWSWDERNGVESHIILRRLAYPEEERAWQDQYTWLSDTVLEFHRAFAPLVNAMLDNE